jgi:hypothetical protein
MSYVILRDASGIWYMEFKKYNTNKSLPEYKGVEMLYIFDSLKQVKNYFKDRDLEESKQVNK